MIDNGDILTTGAFSLAALFLWRLLHKIDKLYDAVCGTTDNLGLVAEVEELQHAVFGRERRKTERRRA